MASLRSFVASKFCSKFVPSLSKFQISRCLAVGSGLGWPALSCRGGGRAERVKFAVPRQGAGVLNPVRTPYRSPGELASPYLSAGLCGDRRSEIGPACRLLFSFLFFVFCRCSKKRSKNGRSKNRLFPEILAILVPPTSIFGDFGSQNGSPEGPPDVFSGLFFRTQFCIDFSSFFR